VIILKGKYFALKKLIIKMQLRTIKKQLNKVDGEQYYLESAETPIHRVLILKMKNAEL